MAHHGLGGVDLNVLRMIAKQQFDGPRLKKIVMMRCRSVRIDIGNVFRIQTRVLHRILHRFRRARTVFSGGSDVIRVGGTAISRYLRINLRTPCLRVLQLFQYNNARAFAHDKTAPFLVKRNGASRRILTGGKCRQSGETADSDRAHTAFRTACHHHLRVPVLNCAERLTDGIGARRTCRHHVDALSL